MANCAICGKPVLAGRVVHNACAKNHNKKELREQFCDTYCRWPHECHDDESLKHYCNSCPLVRLLAMK